MVYPALLPLMRTPRLPVVDWTDAPTDLNGLVRFAETQNLVSARVPSHFNWPLPEDWRQQFIRNRNTSLEISQGSNSQTLAEDKCWSQWPRGLRRGSAAARLLRLCVRFPTGAWMSVCCDCCVLSDRGLCDELITRPEEPHRLWCVVACDLETSSLWGPWPTGGCWAKNKQTKQKTNYVQPTNLCANVLHDAPKEKPTK
jgi:hypothetical protein